jgi:hypothetical protein
MSVTERDFLSTVSPEGKRGFLIAEEHALKRYLSGIRIPRPRGADYEVPVYFRWPSSERTIKYPFITIDLLSIDPAYDLWHSDHDPLRTPAVFEDTQAGTSTVGMYYPSVTANLLPEDVVITDSGVAGYVQGQYLPYRLMFQITTNATHAMDDRVLQGKMLVDRLPPRSFFVGVQADQVWRRGELVQWVSGDTQETTENSNRMFRKIYTITMETEIPIAPVNRFATIIPGEDGGIIGRIEQARRLHVDIYDTAGDTPLPPEHDVDSPTHGSIADHFTTYPPADPDPPEEPEDLE